MSRSVVRPTKQVPASPWGRLPQHWDRPSPTKEGFADVGGEPANAPRADRWRQSVGILGTCIKKAPEFAAAGNGGRRRVARREDLND